MVVAVDVLLVLGINEPIESIKQLWCLFLHHQQPTCTIGDAWCAAAAVASALFILRLENFAQNDAGRINSVSFATGK